MMPTKPGEVYWVDLGMAAKTRPLMVVSKSDQNAPRAMSVCVPLTSEIKGNPDYEIELPRVHFLPGGRRGVANVQGIVGIEHHRLKQKAGQFEAPFLQKTRAAIAAMLELEHPASQAGAG